MTDGKLQRAAGKDVVRDRSLGVRLLDDAALAALVELLLELSPGDRLPSERELTERLGISRNTLRDRIGRLESIGVLTRKQRQGTFYSGLQPEQAGNVLVLGLMLHEMTFESLISVRHALERQAALEACRNVTAEDFLRLTEAVEAMHRTKDGMVLLESDSAFHRALFAASGSPALQFFSQMLQTVLRGTLRHLTLAHDFERMREVHLDILNAVEAGDEHAASLAIDAHFAWLHELRDRELRGEL